VEHGQFTYRGTAKSILNAEVGETVTSESSTDWSLTSGSDVQFHFLADGQVSTLFPAAPPVDVRVELSFGSAESFLLSVQGVRITTLKDPAALLGSMLDGYDHGTFRSGYALVHETVTCDKALVLLARSRNTSLLLSATASIAPTGLADLAGKFTTKYQTQDVARFDSGGQVLFYNAYKVKESFWSGEAQPEPFDTLGMSAEELFDVV
jgi:hypothetical protein